MTTITAKIVADSISPDGKRLTTLLTRYPLCIHAEHLRHRCFSFSVSSARAIPVARMIQDVMDDPFVPLYWGMNKPGMVATEDAPDGVVEHPTHGMRFAAAMWLNARDEAVAMAKAFADAGYHKQIVNRILAPYAHCNVLVSGTEWENFFALRIHEAAEPHMRMLAEAIKAAMDESTPVSMPTGGWHLPFISSEEWNQYEGKISDQLRQHKDISAARCARLSYTSHELKKSTRENEIKLACKLETDNHWSPFEHQATPYTDREHKDLPSSNFVGWVQNRTLMEAYYA